MRRVFCVLAKWYCGCLTILLAMELRKFEKRERDKKWCDMHTFGFEEGRHATEISIAIRLTAAAAREWCAEL